MLQLQSLQSQLQYVTVCFSFGLQNCVKVICVGRQWKNMWEDGMTGIYRLETAHSTGVKRRHELISTDETALTENLLDKTIEHTRKAILNTHRTSSITNQPMMLGRFESMDPALAPAPAAWESDSVAPSEKLHARPRAPVPSAASALALHQGGDDGSDEACVSVAIPGGPELFHLLSSIKPVAAGEAKAKAKPAAKPTPKPKPAARTRGSSVKSASGCGGGDAPSAAGAPGEDGGGVNPKKRGWESMRPAATSAEKGSSVAETIAKGDKQWLDEHTRALKRLLQCLPDCEESKLKAALMESCKEATKLLTAVRSRKRQVKRRTAENAEKAMAEAASIEEHLVDFCELMKLLTKPESSEGNVGDQAYALVNHLGEAGATFSPVVHRLIAKLMWADDLRYQRWADMSIVTLKYAERSIGTDCRGLLAQQMTVALQKLLKAVDVNTASWLH